MVNRNYTDHEFKLLRNDHLLGFVKYPIKWSGSLYKLRVENGKNLPREGTALLLPKHRSFMDPPILSLALYEETGRYVNYIMRTFGFGDYFLEKLGGVRLMIKSKIREIEDNGKRKLMLEVAKEHNRRVWEYVRWLYDSGELVASFPEGGVVHEGMGKLKTGVIRKMLEAQKETGNKIPVIPVGMEYGGIIEITSPLKMKKFRIYKSPAVVRIGEPKTVESDILENENTFEAFIKELGEEIGYLSGLD